MIILFLVLGFLVYIMLSRSVWTFFSKELNLLKKNSIIVRQGKTPSITMLKGIYNDSDFQGLNDNTHITEKSYLVERIILSKFTREHQEGFGTYLVELKRGRNYKEVRLLDECPVSKEKFYHGVDGLREQPYYLFVGDFIILTETDEVKWKIDAKAAQNPYLPGCPYYLSIRCALVSKSP